MNMAAYDPNMGQKIKSDVKGVSMDRAYLAHYNVVAEDAVAADTDGVMAVTNLTSQVQDITDDLNSPAVPRALSITGGVSGQTGNVIITGTNFEDEEITDTIALNGTSTVEGVKAIKEVIEITLPAQTHTPTAQVETVAVTAGSDKSATLVVRVTAAGMTNSPKDVDVAVTADDDTAAEVAAKVRTALEADEDVSDFFDVGGSSANIVLTALTPAANDSSMAIALQSADTSSVTFGASGNTTAGVAYDTVKIGWCDKLGIPEKLTHNTVLKAYLNNALEGTAPTVTTDIDEVEKNTVDLNSALNGTNVDIYFIV